MKRLLLLLALLHLVSLSFAGEDATTVKPVVLKTLVKGKWDAKATLLALTSKSPLCRLAEAETKRAETALYQGFLKEAAKAKRGFAEIGALKGIPLFYQANLVLRFNNRRLLSFLCSEEDFYGGAHGMTHSRTYNFGFVGGKPKRFGLWDALLSDSTSKQELKMMMLGKAMTIPGADWVDEGEITDFTPEMYERFWVNNDALVFEFDPYDLGSFAAGPMTIRVPLAEIKAIVRKDGPIGFLLAG